MLARSRVPHTFTYISFGYDRRSDRIETMEEIMPLERVTVGAGAMPLENVVDVPVAVLAMRMRQCWISTIGYKIFPPLRKQFVVSDNVRYFRIIVQGGYRCPIPNK
jgi:hypothetical protein